MDIPVTNDNASAIGTSTGIGLLARGNENVGRSRCVLVVLVSFSDIPNRCSLVTSQEESSQQYSYRY